MTIEEDRKFRKDVRHCISLYKAYLRKTNALWSKVKGNYEKELNYLEDKLWGTQYHLILLEELLIPMKEDIAGGFVNKYSALTCAISVLKEDVNLCCCDIEMKIKDFVSGLD